MPKKKGKKKGDVLARMTVEQRRQYLERKAAQEQDRARRREELLAGFLKVKLEDEQRKAGLNEAKLNVKWRETLREVKTKSLREQLNNIKTITEESVSSLDSLIKFLHDSLIDARHQRARTSQGHMSFVKAMAEFIQCSGLLFEVLANGLKSIIGVASGSKLVALNPTHVRLYGLHEEHISLLTKNFREKEMHILTSTAEDIQLSASRHLHQTSRLEIVNKAATFESEEIEKEEESKFCDAVSAIRTKLEEEAAEAAVEQERHLENAWWQLATTTKEFEEHTSQIRSQCLVLEEKVNTNRKTLARINQEIRELKIEMACWKGKLTENGGHEDICETKLTNKLQVLRNLLTKQKQRTRETIKISNQRSSAAFEKLNETIRLGERIFCLKNLCHRLESKEDQNIPFISHCESSYFKDHPVCEEHSNESSREIIVSEKVSAENTKDSGLGTSRNTGTNSTTPQNSNRLTMASHVEESMTPEIMESKPILDTGTLSRIKSLIADENAYKEVVCRAAGQMATSDYIDKEADIVLRTHESLKAFWKKRNHVNLQKLKLKDERELLIKENEKLKNNLRNYIKENSLPPNGLSMSTKSQAVEKITKRVGCEEEIGKIEMRPVVDATSVFRIKNMHNRR